MKFASSRRVTDLSWLLGKEGRTWGLDGRTGFEAWVRRMQHRRAAPGLLLDPARCCDPCTPNARRAPVPRHPAPAAPRCLAARAVVRHRGPPAAVHQPGCGQLGAGSCQDGAQAAAAPAGRPHEVRRRGVLAAGEQTHRQDRCSGQGGFRCVRSVSYKHSRTRLQSKGVDTGGTPG